MPESFRDNEKRERFELDVDGAIAFVTYRKTDGAITLVHTEVPPELGGRGIGSKLGRATLDAVRSQGRRLSVECDFIRNFMNSAWSTIVVTRRAFSVPVKTLKRSSHERRRMMPASMR